MDTDRSPADPADGDTGTEFEGAGEESERAEAGSERAEAESEDPTDDEPDGPEGDAIEDRLARLFQSGRTNAIVAWSMVAVLVGAFVESLLGADLLPMVLVAAIAAVVVAPAVAARDPRVIPPWEVLGLALLPVLVRTLFGGELGTFATYLAIAAFALIVTVELQMFTTLRVTHWFAIVFVVLATMATAAAWTVLRWNADRLLGTEFLTTNEALMIEWMYVTLAGAAAGVIFDAYFRRRGARLRRAIRWVVRR
ncbi:MULTISPECIES: hypothetical protein [unclassified Halorubrum]|uniref:hypothetical protein n=1 Tax=unclassified Halorubrum TaxID=2642239 RepID=UPI0014837E23|nr:MULTISPECIES: hypothetical protein [unclassified Halorubrum]